MRSLDRVLTALEARDCSPRGNENAGYKALCPAHEDRNPSLKIDYRDDKVILKCYAGCSTPEIVAALALRMTDLFDEPPRRAERPPLVQRRVVARYDYVDEDGALLYQVERMEPKGFRQRRPDGEGGWIYKLDDPEGHRTRRVLYCLPDVCDAVTFGERIVLCEGEKDADVLRARGMVATTMPHGAGKWRKEYAEFLRGARVALLVDKDNKSTLTGRRAGYEHGLTVYRALRAVNAQVRIFEAAEGCKDVSDHIAAGKPLGELVSLTPEFLEHYHELPDAQSELPGVAPEYKTEFLVMTAREIAEMPDPDRSGYLLGPLINRGHRLMIAAASGHGKSTCSLAMVAAIVADGRFLDWTGSGMGTKALVLDVEQGKGTIKRRIIEAGLAKRDDVIYAIAPDGLALDTDEETCKRIEGLIEEHQPSVVLADPFYKLHRGDPNDMRAAVDLMRRFDAWRARYNFALLLPMHLRKAPSGGRTMSMDEIFGAGAYQWGAEIVIGLERKRNGYSFLHWWKDREGDLEVIDSRWGLLFDRERGFRRDPHDLDRQPTRERVKRFLGESPGATIDEIRAAVEASHVTIRHALEDLGATHTGERTIKERRWTMPDALFSYESLDEALEVGGG